MFKTNRLFVHTNETYIIHISALFDNDTFEGIDVEDVAVEVNDFEVSLNTRKQSSLISLSIRPIGNYKGYEFHPLTFVLTEPEASKAYGNMRKFIRDLWENEYEVFDQNPLEMEIYTHNKKLIKEDNKKVFSDENYDKHQIGLENIIFHDKVLVIRKSNDNHSMGFN